MGSLDGRVAIVTGAGRGLGRAHALMLAREGARVVVNDLGGGPTGEGSAAAPAEAVADEIRAAGGEALPDTEDVTDWDGCGRIVRQALDAWGELHVVVNNAGILDDRVIYNQSRERWDRTFGVHVGGTAALMKHAGAHWRERAKSGRPVKASIINTTSGAGLTLAPRQSAYPAAKLAVVGLTMVAARDLAPYGVRVNAIAPTARTRLTTGTPISAGLMETRIDDFDPWDADHVAHLVTYLAHPDCPTTGAVLHVIGGQIGLYRGWDFELLIDEPRALDSNELAERLPELLQPRPGAELPSEGNALAETSRIMAAVFPRS